jgi:hypothetical protein
MLRKSAENRKSGTIKSFINNQLVSQTNDRSFSKGMCGIGCSFSDVMFDNFKIE